MIFYITFLSRKTWSFFFFISRVSNSPDHLQQHWIHSLVQTYRTWALDVLVFASLSKISLSALPVCICIIANYCRRPIVSVWRAGRSGPLTVEAIRALMSCGQIFCSNARFHTEEMTGLHRCEDELSNREREERGTMGRERERGEICRYCEGERFDRQWTDQRGQGYQWKEYRTFQHTEYN